MDTWKHRDKETWTNGKMNMETWKHGDKETWRQGHKDMDKETWTWKHQMENGKWKPM
jgi:hypothetical protein